MQASHGERQGERDERTAADLRRLLQTLEPLPGPTAHPALIVMVGLPGTGKSHLSRDLAARTPAAIVESDAVRKTLFPHPTYRGQEHYLVFQRAYALVEEVIGRGISVIFDATNLIERHRKELYRIADRHGARLIIVLVQAPAEVVRRRLEARSQTPDSNSDAGWTVYEKMLPTVQPIRREHYVIDTSQDIGPIVEHITRVLRQP